MLSEARDVIYGMLPDHVFYAPGDTDWTDCDRPDAGGFDRPVLLVHGSANRFCLDSGFGGWRAPKLWRLNGPGDGVPGCDGR